MASVPKEWPHELKERGCWETGRQLNMHAEKRMRMEMPWREMERNLGRENNIIRECCMK